VGNKDKGPWVRLFDENDKSGILMLPSKDGSWLRLFDENSKTIKSLP